MAKIVFTLGTVIGSIGGLTFQANGSGYIVRKRPTLHKSSTIRQTQTHLNLQTWLAAWQAITPTNRMDWNTFALANPKTNKFGQVKQLNGMNWFMSVNYMRILMSQTQLNGPPTYNIPNAAPTFHLTLSSTKIEINYDTTFDYTNDDLIIWCALPTNRNLPTINQIRKYCTINSSSPSNPQDITTEWQTATGLIWNPVTQFHHANIWISLQSVRRDAGITGVLNSQFDNTNHI